MSVQLLVAGSGLSEDEGLRAARQRSRWLREGSIRDGRLTERAASGPGEEMAKRGEWSGAEGEKESLSFCFLVFSKERGPMLGLCGSYRNGRGGRSICKQGVAALVLLLWQRFEQWLAAEGRRVMAARGEEDGGAFYGFGREPPRKRALVFFKMQGYPTGFGRKKSKMGAAAPVDEFRLGFFFSLPPIFSSLLTL